MTRDFKLFLNDILQACESIQEFVEGMDFDDFVRDDKTSSAVVNKFEIIGEAVKNLPKFIVEKYPQAPWKDMAGMRDRLIHAYFKIDYRIVWDTIEDKIPEVKSLITQILNDLEEKNNEE